MQTKNMIFDFNSSIYGAVIRKDAGGLLALHSLLIGCTNKSPIRFALNRAFFLLKTKGYRICTEKFLSKFMTEV